MHSSTVLAGRALVMVVCMVVVPVVAVFGTGWTKYLGLSGTFPTGNGSRPGSRPGANPYTKIAHARAAGSTAAGPLSPGGGTARSAGASANSAPPWNQASGSPASAGPHKTASYEVPMGSPASQGAAVAPVAHAAPTPLRPNSPVSASTAANSRPRTAGGSAPPPLPATDWFTWTQQRLRELGATYYLLETWGRNGELYRFHCKMAIAGNQDYTRHFEATDADAARAMQAVLRQVEAWRAGQEP
jgi:hypothetical protein